MSRRGRRHRLRAKRLKTNEDHPYSVAESKAVIALLTWMKHNGSSLHGFQLTPAYFPETGRGVMVRRRLLTGDTIIAIPESLLITTSTVLCSYLGPIIHNFIPCRLTPTETLVIYLLCERRKECRSFWKPYVDVLPSSYTDILHWTSKEIDLLPEFTKHKADVLRLKAKESFKRLSNGFLPVFINQMPQFKGAFSWDLFKWAWSSVNTRCVYMSQPPHSVLSPDEEDNSALAPFLDLLNHTADVEVNARFDDSSKSYKITTLTACEPYDQVFINYGPHSNEKLLLEYGFTLPCNPHNNISLTLNDVLNCVDPVTLLERKRCILESNRFNTGLSLSTDGPSWNLMTCLKILSMNYQEIGSWQRCLQEVVSIANPLLNHILSSLLLQIPIVKDVAESEASQMASTLCEEYRLIIQRCSTSSN